MGLPVLLDLVVQFRIFSKRTAVTSTPDPEERSKPAALTLPGPYSVPIVEKIKDGQGTWA